ncbi:MAG: phosphoribosylanthranilate isomerase [Burkholderiaceae bacterium]|nr:phosphoribosylanthranilate isomerase [Burkholderiaceae bacterium]
MKQTLVMQRTRIKICGLTRPIDVQTAVDSGVDALGFVFYEASARYVTAQAVSGMTASLPPFVSKVGLFVNAAFETIVQTVNIAKLDLLQFHGDESPDFCESVARILARPYMRAIGVGPQTTSSHLLNQIAQYPSACAILLDSASVSYGGSGKTFDWSILQSLDKNNLTLPLVLSGGLNAQNVSEAIFRTRPYAVDVSSGVEHAPGIKDEAKMKAFIQAVEASYLGKINS